MKKVSSFIYIRIFMLSEVSCNKPVSSNNYDKVTPVTIHVPNIKCVLSDSIIKNVEFVPLEVNDSPIFINDDRYQKP